MKKLSKNLAIAAGAFTLGVSSFAVAVQGNDASGGWPVLPGLKTGVDVNDTGGLVFKGNNGVTPTVEIVNSRDGAGQRSPVFKVTGRTEGNNYDSAAPLAVFQSIENSAPGPMVEFISSGPNANRPSVALTVTKDKEVLLREKTKNGNWIEYRFYRLDVADLEYCPADNRLAVDSSTGYVDPTNRVRISSCL